MEGMGWAFDAAKDAGQGGCRCVVAGRGEDFAGEGGEDAEAGGSCATNRVER